MLLPEFNFIEIFLFIGQTGQVYRVRTIFFSIGIFFHDHSSIIGQQGKGEGISSTPHYHFHPFHRHLDIGRAITAESSPLHIGSSRNRTGNLWFPNASRWPLSYAPFYDLPLWHLKSYSKQILISLIILAWSQISFPFVSSFLHNALTDRVFLRLRKNDFPPSSYHLNLLLILTLSAIFS